MHYEIYADSLFLLNLCMNLYLLMLVDHGTPGPTRPGRLVCGAAVGALCFLLSLAGGLPAAVRLVLGGVAGTAGMLCIAFPVRRLRMFMKLLERLLLYSFGIGGGLLFLIGRLPVLREYLTGACGILCAGALLFLFFRAHADKAELKQSFCRATLVRGEKSLSVAALIDSGNSLTEPISGKKVCVVDGKLYESLWGDETEGFRVIPYHSIGKKHGYMQAYLLPKLILDLDGTELELSDVYVAVSGEELSGAGAEGDPLRMIINPELLKKKSQGGRKALWNRRRAG